MDDIPDDILNGLDDDGLQALDAIIRFKDRAETDEEVALMDRLFEGLLNGDIARWEVRAEFEAYRATRILEAMTELVGDIQLRAEEDMAMRDSESPQMANQLKTSALIEKEARYLAQYNGEIPIRELAVAVANIAIPIAKDIDKNHDGALDDQEIKDYEQKLTLGASKLPNESALAKYMLEELDAISPMNVDIGFGIQKNIASALASALRSQGGGQEPKAPSSALTVSSSQQQDVSLPDEAHLWPLFDDNVAGLIDEYVAVNRDDWNLRVGGPVADTINIDPSKKMLLGLAHEALGVGAAFSKLIPVEVWDAVKDVSVHTAADNAPKEAAVPGELQPSPVPHEAQALPVTRGGRGE
jgi:hypothetical protein